MNLTTIEQARKLAKSKHQSRRDEERAAAERRRDSFRLSVDPVTIRLPFPPLLNHYYRTAIVDGHISTYRSSKGKAYRSEVVAAWREVGVTFDGRLAVRIDAVYPNAIKRDLDGILKSLLDSLEHAGAYKDDSQVKLLIVEQSHTESPGWVDVTIGPKPSCDSQATLFETTW